MMTVANRDRMLHVDLSSASVGSRPVPERWRRRFVGGKGLGARYLYDELDAGTDPLGPENVLAFMLGPVSGLLPGETRYAAVTKSPLTGGFLDSYAGGTFPDTLAGALQDHVGLLVTGRAPEPVTLVVADDGATVEPAETWGQDTTETDTAFPDAAVACIGPAGEREVAFATIASDAGEHHAGRGGAGAVMGAKRLKAVVVRGDPPTDLAELREQYAERYREGDTGRWLHASGTVETVDFANEVGALSTRGWEDGQFEGADGVGIEAVQELAARREYDDEGSPGGFRVETEDGETVPRGATAMSLGAGLGIDDFDAVAALGETCNRLGLDLISAGSAVAWAIKANEAGLLERSLSFGSPDDARALLEEIVDRETDLGDALAEGVDAASARLGGDDLLPTVKAMELPAYDPRGARSMALAYATSDRGACHRRALPIEREAFDGDWSPERAAAAVIREQDQRSVLWCLVVDDFVGDAFDDLGAEWLDAVGLDTDGNLATVGERVWTLTRLFNVREGISRADDELPAKLQEPLDSGPNAGAAIDTESFDAMLEAYYSQRGWDADGRPTPETIERLGLADAVDAATRPADTTLGE
ncbi:aldehyde ferredoxin oxidoreductase [Haloarcula sp. CBA1130]|uniref:aldehyde ferredoxin oxidoreductase family protein n=1 Tax=unclassified Haloarcula TaxID=2624677 RepID=UPI001243E8E6|nr:MULTISPECIES: aldehyde ferredoxin oxidoreductase C-terminal domain-containing protein [unclassified Haloarcula]KAA9398064.1 aldehyde ferredoxin oxidoreductase [Haloarcula sp. CBA1129]KAA9402248.1 aldehyde ferredoxin oxidoreductase [Haloarcula sp. CBA1130]